MKAPQYPNFLIVGAPKCGTTALYRYLSRHPSVYMPSVKEPYYFIKPKQPIGEGPKDLSWRNFIDSEEDYAELFAAVEPQHQSIGEASAGYLYFHKLAIPRIKEELGDIKIIIMLRDPIARAFSSHIHHVRAKREDHSFEEAWELQEKRNEMGYWFGFQLKQVSLYSESVKAYMENFSNVKVILNEDLQERTERTVNETFRFLGLQTQMKFEKFLRYNENLLPRSNGVAKFTKRLKQKLPHSTKFVTSLERWNLYRPSIPVGFARSLLAEFHEDILETSDLIERDLTAWTTPYA